MTKRNSINITSMTHNDEEIEDNKTVKKATKVKSGLIKEINQYKPKRTVDEVVDKDLMVHLADIYQSDFEENLTLSSVRLYAKYKHITDVMIDDWKDFLDYQPVAVYRNKYMNDIRDAEVNVQMASGNVKEAQKVRAEIDASEGRGQNASVVVMFMTKKKKDDE